MKKLLFTYSTLCGTGLLLACASQPPISTPTAKAADNIAGAGQHPNGYYQLGRFYEGQNRFDQAIDAYRKALALDPKFIDAHNALGAAYAAEGRLDEAVAEFTIVVAALPVTSYAWNNLGYAYLLQGKSSEAVAALERATAFDLTNQRALNNLGTALAQRGESTAANEKFARAAELGAAPSTTSGSPTDTGTSQAASITKPAIASSAAPLVVPPAAAPIVSPIVSVVTMPPVSSAASSVAPLVPSPIVLSISPVVSPVALPSVSSAASTATPLDPSPVVLSMSPVVSPVALPSVSSAASMVAPLDPSPVVLSMSPVVSPVALPSVSSAASTVAPLDPSPMVLSMSPVVSPVALPVVSSAAPTVGAFVSAPAPLTIAQPIAAEPSRTPPGAEVIVALDEATKASAPIQNETQQTRSPDSPTDNALFVANVDNTGASELVQLAPNVFELRLAPVQPARAVQPIAQNFRLELSNGNGVTGAAKRLGEQLVATGVPKARLTNQKPFRQRVTVIQYRAGYAEVAASLRSRMPNQPRMIKTVLLRPSTDVRVVLGKDLPRDFALDDAAPEVVLVAEAAQRGDGGE